MSRLVSLLAVLAGLRSVAAWLWLRPVLEPDTALYAAGGLGLYPSPLGRAVGSLGVESLAVANAIASVLLVLGAAAIARSSGRREWPAAAIALLAPLALWSIFAGVDTIAAAAVAWAYALRRRWWRSAGLVGVAVGFHLAAGVVVVAWLLWARRGRLAVAAIAAVGLAFVLLTPYRGVLAALDSTAVVTGAIATGAVFVLTFAPWLARLREAMPFAVGGALCAGLVAQASWQTNCRYLLPAVAIASGTVGRSRR